MIKEPLVYFKNLSTFESAWNGTDANVRFDSNTKNDAIIFVEDSGKIYTHGHSFGGGSSSFEDGDKINIINDGDKYIISPDNLPVATYTSKGIVQVAQGGGITVNNGTISANIPEIVNGIKGQDGIDGIDGLTQVIWDKIKGTPGENGLKGDPGEDGFDPYIGADGYWYTRTGKTDYKASGDGQIAGGYLVDATVSDLVGGSGQRLTITKSNGQTVSVDNVNSGTIGGISLQEGHAITIDSIDWNTGTTQYTIGVDESQLNLGEAIKTNVVVTPTYNANSENVEMIATIAIDNEVKGIYAHVGGGTSGEPAQYIKSASYGNNILTLVPKTGNNIEVNIPTQLQLAPYTEGEGIEINNKTVSLKKTTQSTLGGVKVGYTQNGKNYPVNIDGEGNAYVNVPWIPYDPQGEGDTPDFSEEFEDINNSIEEVKSTLNEISVRNQDDVTRIINDAFGTWNKFKNTTGYANWKTDWTADMDTYLQGIGYFKDGVGTWSEYKQKINQIEANVTKLSPLIGSNGVNYEIINSNLNLSVEDIDGFETAVSSLTSQYALTEGEGDRVIGYVTSGIRNNANLKGAFSEVFAEKNDVANNTSAISALQVKVDGLESAEATLASQINNSDSGLAALHTKVTATDNKVESAVATLTTSINDLQSGVLLKTDLDEQVAGLFTKNGDTKAAIETKISDGISTATISADKVIIDGDTRLTGALTGINARFNALEVGTIDAQSLKTGIADAGYLIVSDEDSDDVVAFTPEGLYFAQNKQEILQTLNSDGTTWAAWNTEYNNLFGKTSLMSNKGFYFYPKGTAAETGAYGIDVSAIGGGDRSVATWLHMSDSRGTTYMHPTLFVSSDKTITGLDKDGTLYDWQVSLTSDGASYSSITPEQITIGSTNSGTEYFTRISSGNTGEIFVGNHPVNSSYTEQGTYSSIKKEGIVITDGKSNGDYTAVRITDDYVQVVENGVNKVNLNSTSSLFKGNLWVGGTLYGNSIYCVSTNTDVNTIPNDVLLWLNQQSGTTVANDQVMKLQYKNIPIGDIDVNLFTPGSNGIQLHNAVQTSGGGYPITENIWISPEIPFSRPEGYTGANQEEAILRTDSEYVYFGGVEDSDHLKDHTVRFYNNAAEFHSVITNNKLTIGLTELDEYGHGGDGQLHTNAGLEIRSDSGNIQLRSGSGNSSTLVTVSGSNKKMTVSGSVEPSGGINVPFTFDGTDPISYSVLKAGTDNAVGCCGLGLSIGPANNDWNLNMLYSNFKFTGGDVYIGDSSNNQNLYVNGQLISSSDRDLKNVGSDITLTAEQVANAPAVNFTWKNDENNINHVGSIAQYWQVVMPEVVSETKNGLGLDYSTTALMSAITVAKKVVELEEKIAQLEAKINELTSNN